MLRPRSLLAFSLVLITSACGRLGFDEPPGVIVEPPPSGPVSITLSDPWGAVADHPVVFHGADGSLLGETQTDAQGTATYDVSDYTMITVPGSQFSPTGADYTLFTYMGVKAGDTVALGDDTDPWAALGQVEVHLPGAFKDAAYYAVTVGCAEASDVNPDVAMVLELNAACFKGASSASILAVAVDANDSVLGHTVIHDVAVANGEITIVDMPTWQMGFDQVTMNFIEPPATSTYADIKYSAVAGQVAFYAGSDGGEWVGGDSIGLQFPSGLATGVEYLLCVYHTALAGLGPGTTSPRFLASGESVSYLLKRHAGVPELIDLDLGVELLPAIWDTWYEYPEDSRPKVVYDHVGDFSVADAGVARFAWIDDAGAAHEWWVMFPPGANYIQLPELPDSMAAYRPSPAFALDQPQIVIFDADFVAGYDDMRNQHGFRLVLDEHAVPRTDAWTIRASSGPGGFWGI